MAHNVESIFYVRKTLWHGLGIIAAEALSSADALKISGLDWSVKQCSIFT